jgi:Mg2+ and Co2+ transporter CorA
LDQIEPEAVKISKSLFKNHSNAALEKTVVNPGSYSRPKLVQDAAMRQLYQRTRRAEKHYLYLSEKAELIKTKMASANEAERLKLSQQLDWLVEQFDSVWKGVLSQQDIAWRIHKKTREAEHVRIREGMKQ